MTEEDLTPEEELTPEQLQDAKVIAHLTDTQIKLIADGMCVSLPEDATRMAIALTRFVHFVKYYYLKEND